MRQYKEAFDRLMCVGSEPNEHEIHLFKRGQYYISKLAKIPGVEMIAIVNSLSMYATHPDSDIDLFIITKPSMIWFVRFWSTLILWTHGVWRRNQDIAGNLCLSFFVTTEAMNLSHIAIENDIYLYYWIYYMRPIVDKNKTYKKFLAANNWVSVDEDRKRKNIKYKMLDTTMLPFCHSEQSGGIPFKIIVGERKKILHISEEKRDLYEMTKGTETNSKSIRNSIGEIPEDPETSPGEKEDIGIYKKLNNIIRYFLLPRTQRTYEQMGKPEGIIISDEVLKFHDRDKRREIRDQLI